MARTLSTHKELFHLCRLGMRTNPGSNLRPGLVLTFSTGPRITQGPSNFPAPTPPAPLSPLTPSPRPSATTPSAPPSFSLSSSSVVHPDPRGFPVPQDATHTPPRQTSPSSPHPRSATCRLAPPFAKAIFTSCALLGSLLISSSDHSPSGRRTAYAVINVCPASSRTSAEAGYS